MSAPDLSSDPTQTLREALAAIVEGEPWYDAETDDCCWFCGAYASSWSADDGSKGEHNTDCAWAAARALLADPPAPTPKVGDRVCMHLAGTQPTGTVEESGYRVRADIGGWLSHPLPATALTILPAPSPEEEQG